MEFYKNEDKISTISCPNDKIKPLAFGDQLDMLLCHLFIVGYECLESLLIMLADKQFSAIDLARSVLVRLLTNPQVVKRSMQYRIFFLFDAKAAFLVRLANNIT